MILNELLSNIYLISALIGWFVAQLIKFTIYLIKHRSLDLKLFVASGGMPSSHSSFVVGLTGALGFDLGWGAPITALSIVFALVVMYDAAGVRRAAGKQAEILNKLIFEDNTDKNLTEQRLKELIGHTPVEVLAGAILGFLVAYLVVF
ncbi:divergent PAP2 family protein [Natranaerobius thermophilus]|uniref:Acid phosphatase/vanadium-dependent haloperoxidase related n=1 Tax=Natranaerobius thermophilus (strain ATCC BAA-1301 / DSM 18059 / JW/NM-WN-LF) TaxID=457570 RepID=B2A528_NATTJ|nr:divergent PAP2 family protein [Natranaerobius thermophilus]ACB85270.1 acid phosphatase/vanadium-dependent haloperoxidase related [Natranaerobius thermophilus JW/NM-WN-LF]